MYMYSRAAVRLFVYNYVYGYLLYLIYSLCKQMFILMLLCLHTMICICTAGQLWDYLCTTMSTDIFCISSIHYVNKCLFWCYCVYTRWYVHVRQGSWKPWVRLFVYNYVYGYLLYLIYSLCKQIFIFDVIVSTHDDMYMYSRAAVRLFVYNYVYGYLLYLIYSLCKQMFIFDVIVSTHDDMYMYVQLCLRISFVSHLFIM